MKSLSHSKEGISHHFPNFCRNLNVDGWNKCRCMASCKISLFFKMQRGRSPSFELLQLDMYDEVNKNYTFCIWKSINHKFNIITYTIALYWTGSLARPTSVYTTTYTTAPADLSRRTSSPSSAESLPVWSLDTATSRSKRRVWRPVGVKWRNWMPVWRLWGTGPTERTMQITWMPAG